MMSSYTVLTNPCHQLQNDDDNDKTSGIGGMIWQNSIHWNMYITICETDDQGKLDAWSRALKASALRQSRGMG